MIKEAAKDITDFEVDLIDPTVEELRRNFLDNRTQDLTFRKSMLQNVVRGVQEMEKDFIKALYDDMKIDEASAYVNNVLMLKNEALDCIEHLGCWYIICDSGQHQGESALPWPPGLENRPSSLSREVWSW